MPEHVIVVGAGGIAGAWFPPLLAEGVVIDAVVDLQLAAATARLREYGVDAETSTNLKAMLKKYAPDFVLDLTIPEAHCAVTCTALRAGCHVLGEKPMAATMAEARRMVRTAEETGKTYVVSQSRRWQPFHDSIRRTVDAGKLGRLTTINCDFYLAPHFGGFRDAMPSPLLLDMAIHHFDLARALSGLDPVAVYAHEFNPAGSWYQGKVAATCIFEMSDGVVFTYRGSWCAEGCGTSWHGDWRLIGDQGTLCYAGDREPYGEVLTAERSGFFYPVQPLAVEPSPLAHCEMHGALREMLALLRTGARPQTECHDNIQSLAMVFAAIESARKGKRIPIHGLALVREKESSHV